MANNVNKQQINNYLSKIETKVSGLDDLFYGGLRFPNPYEEGINMSGIVIVIYGPRGVSKSNLAMQIMRGVHESMIENVHHSSEEKPLFCTLHHRVDEWEKEFRSQEVMEAIDTIKLLSAETNIKCKICDFFGLRSIYPCKDDIRNSTEGESCKEYKVHTQNCQYCRLIRNEIITYNPRLESLHYNTQGATSENNLFCRLNQEKIKLDDINPENLKSKKKDALCSFLRTKEEKERKSGYQPEPLLVFNNVKRKIKNDLEEMKNKKHGSRFGRSSVVIEGFSILDDDTLKAL